ncbi:MAG: hemerythrin domain-containing protein [Streptosporangiaceae bacterium]
MSLIGVTMSTSANTGPADERAFHAILDHHASLRRDLDERVAALRTAVDTSAPHDRDAAALATFLAESVLPHAAAEEQALYATAARDTATRLLVDAMTVEHRALTDQVHALGGARTAHDAFATAEAIRAVFTLHVDRRPHTFPPAFEGMRRTPAGNRRGDHHARARLPSRDTTGIRPPQRARTRHP